jgi:hypothetical protein
MRQQQQQQQQQQQHLVLAAGAEVLLLLLWQFADPGDEDAVPFALERSVFLPFLATSQFAQSSPPSEADRYSPGLHARVWQPRSTTLFIQHSQPTAAGPGPA